MEMGLQSPVIPSVNSQDSGPTFSRLLLNTGFVLFLTVDLCAGFLYLLFSRNFKWVEVIPTALAMFSGLTAGILSRLFFKQSAKIVRWIIACIVIGMTLALAGLVIQEWIQVDLTGIWYVLVKPDFAILTGMGCITALLAVFAWQGKKKTESINLVPSLVEEKTVNRPTRRPSRVHRENTSHKRSLSIIPADLPRRYFRKSIWRKWVKKSKTDISRTFLVLEKNLVKPIGSFIKQIFETQPQIRQQSNRMTLQSVTHRTNSPVLSPTPLPRKRLGRKMRSPIRLFGREELRCPYCLQEVNRRDPKGVVVCPICKSAHHKECWDITGSCQVPHNHAVL
jgi:hypothetical protein